MTHSLDNGKTRFRKLVAAALEAKPRLPLVHSTDTYAFRDALSDGKISPQPCNVFKKETLTYFFYGRPSYRPNADEQPSGLGHYFPVCLLFDPNKIANVRRIFPFDSGAFENAFYDAFLHKNMQLGDFGLEPDLSTPGRVISLFFGSVPAYLTGRANNKAQLDPAQFEASSYSALIGAKGSNDMDSRGTGIEIQTAEPLDIKTAVLAVILPSTFAETETGDAVRSLGIEVIPYRTYERMRPNEFTSKLSDLCLDYFIRKKLVAESDL